MIDDLRDLQKEADRRNVDLIDDYLPGLETKAILQQFWFVRDPGLVLVPLQAASHKERIQVLHVWKRVLARMREHRAGDTD